MKDMEPFVQIDPSSVTSDPVAKEYYKINPSEEVWVNDLYKVNVRKGIPIKGIETEKGKPATMTHLSICRIDHEAVIDWRHMQWIKNEIVGEENEGCDIYPAESRLVDGSNQYHIWVFENPEVRFPFGFQGRVVTENPMVKGSTQRPWSKSRRPKDIAKSEAIIEKMFNTLKDATEKEGQGD